MGYSPWGCKELDMTERLHFTNYELAFIKKETPWTEEPGGLQSMGSQKSQTLLGKKTTTVANLYIGSI